MFHRHPTAAILCALVASAASSLAFAQSNVTVYGLIDATLGTKNNTTGSGGRLTGVQTAWFSGNRLGFTGTEDLGGGLAAIFKLESEYLIATGEMDTPGVIFNRDAWVGLRSNDFGQFTLGRQNTLPRDFAQIYGDPYGSNLGLGEGGFTNNNNFKQIIFYAGSATGTRYDNGLVWKKVFGNGVVAGLGYQLGEVAGSFSKNTSKAAAIGYNGTDFLVSGFINEANVNNLIHKSYSVGGSYLLPTVRINAGYFHYTADQGTLGGRTDNAYTVSAKLAPSGLMDYELGYQIMKTQNGAISKGGSTVSAYADGSTAPSTGTGKKSTLYGSAFYHLSKRTELYVAADYMRLNDGYKVAGTNGFANQTEVAVGMRTRF